MDEGSVGGAVVKSRVEINILSLLLILNEISSK